MTFWHEAGIAISLLFILEGVLPFLAPDTWRNWMRRMADESDRSLRMVGLVSMLLGLLFLYLIN